MLTLSIFTFTNFGILVLVVIIIILGVMNSTTSRAYHEVEAENLRLRVANSTLENTSIEFQNTIENQVHAIMRLQKQSDEYNELDNKNKKTISDLNGQVASLKQDNATLISRQIPIFVYLDHEPATDDAKDLKSYKSIVTIAKKLVGSSRLRNQKITALRSFLYFAEKQEKTDDVKKDVVEKQARKVRPDVS